MSGIDKAISSITADMALSGISKDRSSSQGYRYRGIDDVMQALSALLPKYGLAVYPSMVSRSAESRTNAKGTLIFRVVCGFSFLLVSVADGTTRTVEWIAEADDSGDKATNKAGSVAYREMCLKLFCIPVNGNDADTETDHNEYKPEKKLEEALVDSVELEWDRIDRDVKSKFASAKTKADISRASTEVVRFKGLGAPKELIDSWRMLRDSKLEGMAE